MKTKTEFNKQSFLAESFYKFLNFSFEDSYKECYTKLTTDLHKHIIKSSNDLMKGISSAQAMLNQHRFQEGLELLGETYSITRLINTEIRSKHKNIKSLVIGIMLTSSIVRATELESYKKQWRKYENTNGGSYLTLGHHKHVYHEFIQVKTMQELINFNAYFRNFICTLLLELENEIPERLQFTIAQFEGEASLNDFKTELIHLRENFLAKNTLAAINDTRIF